MCNFFSPPHCIFSFQISLPCWEVELDIGSFSKNFSTSSINNATLELWAFYQSKTLQIWDTQAGHHDTKIILWASSLTKAETFLNSSRYIIQTQLDLLHPVNQDLYARGFQLLFSPSSTWDLSFGWNRSGRWYDWDEILRTKLPSDKRQVLGGEVKASLNQKGSIARLL